MSNKQQPASKGLIVPLQQWITKAVQITTTQQRTISTAYLQSSIKIAIFLTEQIAQAEKLYCQYGISKKLDLLPTGCGGDWSNFANVTVGCDGGSLLKVDEWEPLPARIDVGDEGLDEDEQLGSFLRESLLDEPEIDGGIKSVCNGVLRSSTESTLMSSVGRGLSLSCTDTDAASTDAPLANYLQINWAVIECPESDPRIYFGINDLDNAAKDKLEKMQRMYYLGLLLYELFAGGEVPPSNLHELASSNGAFISLSNLTLVKNNENTDTSSSNHQPKRHQKGTNGDKKELGLCELSIEYLKLFKGLPCSICSLVFNLLDCVYGDLSSNECYTDVTDVTLDLKAMLDKPDIYLKDLDTNRVSATSLQLDKLINSRENEYTSIINCYRQCLLGSCELVIIKGESGSGKSWLAQKVGKYITLKGGEFLMGKYDQMTESKPFSVLSSAFNQYCDILIREKESTWGQTVLGELKAAFGEHAALVTKVISKLGSVLDNTSHEQSLNKGNCQNAIQRLQHLLCQFVEVISSHSQVALALFIDDVQWIDKASVLVINRILRHQYKKFFFIACSRDDEIGTELPFWKMIEKLSAIGISTTTIKLSNMKEDELNTGAAELLHLPPRIVRPLSSTVYKQTRGNPLFILQLFRLLLRERLLKIDLPRKRWVWDLEKICSMKLPDDVAYIFAKGMSTLPSDVQVALHTLALFGASLKLGYIKLLESQLNLKLIEPLDKAVDEGLVSTLKGTCQDDLLYSFCHDRIQEVSYNMIEEQQRRGKHISYGQCLANVALDSNDDDLLFIGVAQVNLGGPAAADKDQYFNMSYYNLIAGKKAMEMSAFAFAHSFFQNGILFLPEENWRDYYDFSLSLYELAAKTSLATGNIQDLSIYSNQVTDNARCFEDQLQVHFIMTMSLVHASKMAEALKNGVAILQRLGVSINLSKEALDQQMSETQSIIKGVSEDDIINLSMMTDAKKIITMKFLGRLSVIAYYVQPSMNQFLVLKMVQMSIRDGLSPMSVGGFASFGSFLAKFNNIQAGRRFIVLARSLIDRLPEAKEFEGCVMATAGEVQSYVDPLPAAIELHVQGESAAINRGDSYWACVNRLLYCHKLFWSGAHLPSVFAAFSKACILSKEHGAKAILCFILTVQRTVSSLLGDEHIMQANDQENKTPRQLVILYFHDMYSAFLMLHNADLKECCERFFHLNANVRSNWLGFLDSAQGFIAGLASFRVYRATQDSCWLEKGVKSREDMKFWAEKGSLWNFQHKLFLLQAEEHYSLGDFEAARGLYQKAITCAQEHKFLNDEALACELAAKFYFDTDDLPSSLEYFRLSHEKYTQWGAIGKATKLFTYITTKFSSCLDTS